MKPSLTWRRWALLAALALGLAGAGVLPAAHQKGKSLPEDLALVGDSVSFARFDVGKGWGGPEAATLRKVCRAHPVVPLWEGHGVEERLGLKWEDVDRAVVYFRSYKQLGQVRIVLTTREPYDRDKVVAALAPGGKEEKVKDRAYVADDKAGFGVHFRDKRTLVIGSPAGVKEFLTEAPGEPGALAEALAEAAKGPLLAAGMDPRPLAADLEKSGPQGKAFLPLFRARSWQLTADGGGDALTLRFRFTFPDEAAATAGKAAVEGAVPRLQLYLAQLEKGFPDFLKRQAATYKEVADLREPLLGTVRAARAGLQGAKAVQEGAVVRADVRLKTKTPATALLMLATLMPRAAKK